MLETEKHIPGHLNCHLDVVGRLACLNESKGYAGWTS